MFALLGIPAHQTSISPTRADTTPLAVREALLRYSTYCASHDQDLRELEVFDAGNVKDPDHEAGEQRVHEKLQELKDKFIVAIGGDNSITYSVATGLWGSQIANAGLITFDATTIYVTVKQMVRQCSDLSMQACRVPALFKSGSLIFPTHPNTPSGRRNTASP